MNKDSLNVRIHCHSCGDRIYNKERGQPYLKYKNNDYCYQCYLGIIEPIYQLSGMGDGGLINLAFKTCLTFPTNRKKRRVIGDYKSVLKQLLHKYKFCCVSCGEKEEKKLTIDHIKPVSKGGTDELQNLQILCRSCNSKKGAK